MNQPDAETWTSNPAPSPAPVRGTSLYSEMLTPPELEALRENKAEQIALAKAALAKLKAQANER
jgi:hypothetical protein